MSMDDHIKNVDWKRVHKKRVEMDRAKRQIQGALIYVIPLWLLLNTGILNQLDQLSPYVRLSSLKMVFNILMGVFSLLGMYSGFNYLKWSRYDIMRSSELNSARAQNPQ